MSSAAYATTAVDRAVLSLALSNRAAARESSAQRSRHWYPAGDAPYAMDLDDGVLVNSAALWPLVEPQWKDPKKWWKELARAEGRKDYDWAHLAARYFPSRVAKKCEADPSLAVAHGCFWRLHPARAYAWELRLQDEIRAGFTLDEADSNACRARFLKEQPEEAKKIREAEQQRRERKARKAGAEDGERDDGELFAAASGDESDGAHAEG